MASVYELQLPSEIFYNREDTVPLKDIIRSLQGLDGLLKTVHSPLGSLLDLDIKGVIVKLEKTETGSQIIKYWLALRFATEEDVNKFLYKLGQDHPNIVRIIDILVAGTLIFAVHSMLTGTNEPTVNIENNQGVVLAAGSNITGFSKEELKQAINDAIQEHPESKRAALDLAAPAKNASGTSIEFRVDGRKTTTITPEAIQEFPNRVPQYDLIKEKSYENVKLDIRATDLDSTSTGWSVVADGLNKRISTKLYPNIDPQKLIGTVYAEISVFYEPDQNDPSQLVPVNLIIKGLNKRGAESSSQTIAPQLQNEEYTGQKKDTQQGQQASLFDD